MTQKFLLSRSKTFLLVGALTVSISGIAQNPSTRVFEDWNTTSGTQNNFQRTIVRSKALGGATYYYLCGATLNSSGNYDMLVQKKNSSGTVLWSNTYSGAGNKDDYATDVQIDAVGNVYICGTYYKDATDSNNAVIIKYNTAGTHKWTKTYNGTGSRHDAFAAMQVAGNVVVAVGTTWKNTTNLFDMLAMRVDSSGNTVWTQTWDHVNLNDVAVNLWNNGTKIYIAGGAQSATTTYKYAVVNVKASDGSIQGSTVTGGTAFGFDKLTDIQYDLNGYVYLTGGVINTGTVYDIKTVKLDTALNIIWSATYASSGAYNDVGTGLAIDQVGNVIVTGYRTTSTTGQDYVTIKYSSGGTQRWVSTWDGGFAAQDSATAIVVSPTDTNKIYVTGSSWNISSKDYQTLKYDGAGNLKWAIGFNNAANTDDRATSIALDTVGNIIVAGQNKLAWNSHIYTTVRYVEKSTTVHKDTIALGAGGFIYTENKGQLLDLDTNAVPEVKFYSQEYGQSMYFMDTAVAYVLERGDTSSANPDSLFRVDMKFVSANSNLRIRGTDQREDYNNYFYHYATAARVHNYDQLVSFNVWNGVDVIYGSNSNGFKYYFICKPIGGGGSSGQIDLFYDGADSVTIGGSGELIIHTPLGNIVQPRPQVWQLDANGNFSGLAWQPSYSIIGTNEVAFTGLGSYNTALPLVIAIDRDNVYPTVIVDNLMWSTYYGGGRGDSYHDVEVCSSGEVFVCGQTQSTNFPTSFGALQTTIGSMFWSDAIIVSFETNGARRWATYYGGSDRDFAEGIDVDSAGCPYIVGWTESPYDSAQHPFYWNLFAHFNDSTLNGTADGFMTHLTYTGDNILWATYLGGDGNDYAWDVECSPYQGEVYVVGHGDPAGFPYLASNGWVDTAGGGMIWRFWADGTVWYSCFIGPTNNSATIKAVTTDSLGYLIIAGYTQNGFPVTSGCAQFTYGGGTSDGFVAKISPEKDQHIVWATYHGGELYDEILGIDVSPFGSYPHYFAVGRTQSDSLPVTNPGGGAYVDSTLSSALEDMIIVDYDSTGVRHWATYYGDAGIDEAYDVTTDEYGNIYVFGQTTSSSLSMPTAPSLAFDDQVFTGPGDAVLLMFSEGSRDLYWSTYFGGSGGESGYGIDSRDTALYIVGDVACDVSLPDFPFRPGYNIAPYGAPYYAPTGSPIAPNGWKAFIAEFTLNPLVVGVQEPSPVANNPIGVYPNPSTSNIWVTGTVGTKNTLTIEILDVLGQVVYSEKLTPALQLNKSIDVSNLANGMYVVRVVADQTTYTNKLLIQK